VLVLAAVVVSVLAVQTTPARAAASAEGWVWPLAGPPPVTRGFDPPAERYGRGHRGVDLGGAPGAVVVAAGAGRVSYAGCSPAAGSSWWCTASSAPPTSR
jgi:murein DD-endopeptidase MepM/ murein hydrolase activator NlpD